MTQIVDVYRAGQGHLAEEVEMDKRPDDWSYSDVFHFIGKMGFFIQSQGDALPTEVTTQGSLAFFRVATPDGRVVVTANVHGLSEEAITGWRNRKPQ